MKHSRGGSTRSTSVVNKSSPTLSLLRIAAHVSTAPLVAVARHGGLCIRGGDCRLTFRITDTAISGDGMRPRRLTALERRQLLRAIAALDWRTICAHPFKGTCPTASDGPESTYTFRGFAHPLASCRYDLRLVQAVRVTERLLATLRSRS